MGAVRKADQREKGERSYFEFCHQKTFQISHLALETVETFCFAIGNFLILVLPQETFFCSKIANLHQNLSNPDQGRHTLNTHVLNKSRAKRQKERNLSFLNTRNTFVSAAIKLQLNLVCVRWHLTNFQFSIWVTLTKRKSVR